jgi:RNA polymerase sigma-70 factor (ECF subfamily)
MHALRLDQRSRPLRWVLPTPPPGDLALLFRSLLRGQPLAAAVTLHPLKQRDQDERFQREALPWLDDVYRFALSLTRDETDAEDVVQDTYLRAYKSWHTYAPGSDCRRWLFTICRNAFLRARERDRTTVELVDTEADLMAASTLFFEALRSGYEDLQARVDLAQALTEALGRLPEPFRSAVLIVDVEDQPYEAAAEILGVPIGTVRSRLFRGRRLLQEQLLAYARDAGLGGQWAPVECQAHD